MVLFSSFEQLPDDPILGLQTAFLQDPRKNKVNLGIGAYKNGAGESQVFDVVRQAEKILFEKNLNKEYIPIEGDASFIQACKQLVFGQNHPNVFAAQMVGGTSALRIGGDLLRSKISSAIYLPDPTWLNHGQIFSRIGMKVETYPYYDGSTRALDFEGIKRTIEAMPPSSTILLHGCCHNPTGIDPTLEQWKELSKLLLKKQVIPFFDLAYQGFGRGVEEDAASIRQFVADGHEMLVATSYSKNFGLYGERVGMLAAVMKDEAGAKSVGSHMKSLIRTTYSSPPLQGERIVAAILQDPKLKESWEAELSSIRARIDSMRGALADGLKFDFLKKQLGMFSYTGLNPDQVSRLLKDFAIHMPKSGRINVAGLNENNLQYVIQSIITVLS